jgi:hypothetical protein
MKTGEGLATGRRRAPPEQMLQMTGAPRRHLCRRQAQPEEVGVASATGRRAQKGSEVVGLETVTARGAQALARVTWTEQTTPTSNSHLQGSSVSLSPVTSGIAGVERPAVFLG